MCFHEGVPVPTCSPALPGGAGAGDGHAVGSFLCSAPGTVSALRSFLRSPATCARRRGAHVGALISHQAGVDPAGSPGAGLPRLAAEGRT